MENVMGIRLVKVTEKGLPMNQSHDDMRGHLATALRAAHGVSNTDWSPNGPHIADTFPGHVVYQHGGQLYRRSYTSSTAQDGAAPKITLGDPKPVHRSYADTKPAKSLVPGIPKYEEAEAVLLDVDDTPVQEAAADAPLKVREGVAFDGPVNVKESAGVNKVPVKLIAPGWGSMAYYPKEVLKRDGPSVFTKGTHMMWNHASATEEADRPEGSLDNLAAVLTKDAEWKDAGPQGPGLYSEAKVFSDYAQQVAEKGGHIGVSINAYIKGKEGSAEGRTGRIAEGFLKAISADFVTKAGAGGAPIVPVMESDRGPKQERHMSEQGQDPALVKENADLRAQLAEIRAKERRTLAAEMVGAVLKEAGIRYAPPLLDRLCQSPVVTEAGDIDPAWVKSIVADFSGATTGQVRNMGVEQTQESDSTPTDASTAKRLREALKSLGTPEAGLDIAVAGRA